MNNLNYPQKNILAIDVGGTKSRAQLANLDNNIIIKLVILSERIVGSKKELSNFIYDLLKTHNQKIDACVIDFAGPVNNQKVRMTNWKNTPTISQNDLHNWGLPANTIILNDLEAAAYGVIDLVEKNRKFLGCIPLFKPLKIYQNNLKDGNMVLIVPGTGLGTAGIVTIKLEAGKFFKKPIASEIQHFPVSPINKDHEELINYLRKRKDNDKDISWEDFVSGKGLKNIYEGLIATKGFRDNRDHEIGFEKDLPKWIAENAVRRNDTLCIESMDIYCKCMGRIAQLMALAYMPYAGIFIGGDVSIRNKDFIKESNFIQELHSNQMHKDLLMKFPVYLTEQELNINGCFWVSCHERC